MPLMYMIAAYVRLRLITPTLTTWQSIDLASSVVRKDLKHPPLVTFVTFF